MLHKPVLPIATMELERMRFDLREFVVGTPKSRAAAKPAAEKILQDPRLKDCPGYLKALPLNAMESDYLMMKAKAAMEAIQAELAQRT